MAKGFVTKSLRRRGQPHPPVDIGCACKQEWRRPAQGGGAAESSSPSISGRRMSQIIADTGATARRSASADSPFRHQRRDPQVRRWTRIP